MSRISLPVMQCGLGMLAFVVLFVVYWAQSSSTVLPLAPQPIDISVYDSVALANASFFNKTSSNTSSIHHGESVSNKHSPPLEIPSWWNDLSDRLCPNMAPRAVLAHKLFPLARMELKNISAEEFPLLNVSAIQVELASSEDLFGQNFYAWSRSWEGMSRQSDGPVPGIFSLPKMWKVANNQLDGFWLQVFENLPDDASQAKINAIKKRRKEFEKRLYPFRTNVPKGAKECIVIVIRDPISHFLSAYNEVQYRIETYHKSKREALAQWPAGAFEASTPERFQQFLIDILSWPVTHKFPGVRVPYPQNMELQHMFSMSGVLALLSSESNRYKSLQREIHVLPTIANLEETLGPYIVESCPDSFEASVKSKIVSTKVNTTLGEHPTSGDPVGSYAASKQVFHDGGAFARALCAMHLMDYACWQDLPDGVPEVCMELYHSYHTRGVFKL